MEIALRKEEFTLPSSGIPYIDPSGKLLIPGGVVQIREMTGAEESILNNQSLNDSARMSQIVGACVAFPNGFKPAKLLVTDRLVLLMAIREVSLGSKYRLNCRCDECRAEFNVEVNLVQSMNVEVMPRVVEVDGKEVTNTYDPAEGIPVDLDCGISLKLKLLTCEDEDFVVRECGGGKKSKFVPKTYRGDHATILRKALVVKAVREGTSGEYTSVNHSDPRMTTDICDLLGKLPTRCLNVIDQTYGQWDVGLTTEISEPCPSCGSVNDIQIVIGSEFFRPTNV